MIQLRAILIAFLMAVSTLPAYANTAQKTEPVIYIAKDERPSRVISYLLGLFGRELITSDLPSTPVSGRFKVSSVEDVMGYFTAAYQMNWFQNGSSVYLYRARDWKTRKIYVGDFPPLTDWEDLLKNSGLHYPQFSVVYNEKHDELIASGPLAYLKLLESAFGRERPEPGQDEPDLMVFTLKHASVEDREINLRDRTFVSKGALTVLLELLGLKNHSSVGTTVPTPVNRTTHLDPLKPAGSIGQQDFVENQTSTRRTDIPSKAQKEDSKISPFSVTADPRTNSIVIRDTRSRYEYYRKLIEQLDAPIAMVEVEAMLVEVDKATLDELGMEFGLRAGGVQYDFPGENIELGTVSLYSGASSVVDPGRFLARIRALIADQNAKVLARPNIVTQDNIPAFIDLSETQYLRVTGERVAQIVPVTAGSLLQVTPRLVRKDSGEEIFLRVDIQDGSLTQAGEGSPTVRNTVLSTQAVVNVEKALLIGGYNRDSENSNNYKMPLLGDLPFIGKAFSYTEKQKQTMVRLFLITPRVIELPPDGRSSTKRAIDTIKENFRLENDENLKMTPSLNLGRLPQQSISLRQ
ncbi:MAG: EscC/YscC/HrcC family type III secretion system outer membrane ring protein [Limnobacter sp.]|uniref:type III secretion system outer membrane ring subunit SctC n=1 Tax=Limnobacter sp. TaxID=2003368 RepID=UPI00121E3617|nr:type III secretion system outer membrane ring subunit SctC [Limnobacter sp.]RZO93763.1 MAG: EscC/YscC/HrcC family type III secretion system outer membrane ring protein [Limnobacter sp.]